MAVVQSGVASMSIALMEIGTIANSTRGRQGGGILGNRIGGRIEKFEGCQN